MKGAEQQWFGHWQCGRHTARLPESYGIRETAIEPVAAGVIAQKIINGNFVVQNAKESNCIGFILNYVGSSQPLQLECFGIIRQEVIQVRITAIEWLDKMVGR